MTTRTAELLMAIVMGLFSVYLMWKSAELPIGWIPDEGPGGGAWPFWLSAIMLISCIWITVNWFRRASPPSRSSAPYLSLDVLVNVGGVALALIITVALFYVIGVYGALPLFIIFYMRVMGRHSLSSTLMTALTIPVVTFLFFEIALKITLPKGYTEPWFYPLYKLLL